MENKAAPRMVRKSEITIEDHRPSWYAVTYIGGQKYVRHFITKATARAFANKDQELALFWRE